MISTRRIIAALAVGAAFALLGACSTSTDDVGTTHAQAAAAAPAAAPKVKTDFSLNTAGQKLAIQSAVSYLKTGDGFSELGLYRQLTSSYGDGVTKADALNAINAVESGQLSVGGSDYQVNWNMQAIKSAEGYVTNGIVSSRADLLRQLTSSAGEQFTQAQANRAAKAVGLG